MDEVSEKTKAKITHASNQGEDLQQFHVHYKDESGELQSEEDAIPVSVATPELAMKRVYARLNDENTDITVEGVDEGDVLPITHISP